MDITPYICIGNSSVKLRSIYCVVPLLSGSRTWSTVYFDNWKKQNTVLEIIVLIVHDCTSVASILEEGSISKGVQRLGQNFQLNIY